MSASAQIAIHSALNLGVYADANESDFLSQVDTFSVEHFGSLAPFSHSLSVTDVDTIGSSVTTTSAASADWTSSGQGNVAWRGMGWIHHTDTTSGAKLNGYVNNSLPVWSYTFKATGNAVFTMNYDVRATGDPFGLLGAIIQWSGPGGNLNISSASSPVAHGVFTRTVMSGTTYTVGVYNGGNIFTAPLPRNDFANMDADFAWRIAVPEPMSIVPFALGCAFVIRRLRKTVKVLNKVD